MHKCNIATFGPINAISRSSNVIPASADSGKTNEMPFLFLPSVDPGTLNTVPTLIQAS